MNPEKLFIARFDKMQSLAESFNEAEILDLASIIRQLFIDKFSLIDVVNTDKIKLQFCVGRFPDYEPNEEKPFWYSLEDGFDPETSPFPDASIIINRDKFVAYPAAILHGKIISVKDVITYAANVAGGVHYDQRPEAKHDVIHKLQSEWMIGGFPYGIRVVRAITRVAIRGLKPLALNVTSRTGS